MDFFFFQAEDGIRDYKVTGVQTCALPISRRPIALDQSGDRVDRAGGLHHALQRADAFHQPAAQALRSEEHTSELQSPCNLVCRLLLEKKKHKVRPRAQSCYRMVHK